MLARSLHASLLGRQDDAPREEAEAADRVAEHGGEARGGVEGRNEEGLLGGLAPALLLDDGRLQRALQVHLLDGLLQLGAELALCGGRSDPKKHKLVRCLSAID